MRNENLKALVHGHKLTTRQRADAVREFESLESQIEKLKKTTESQADEIIKQDKEIDKRIIEKLRLRDLLFKTKTR